MEIKRPVYRHELKYLINYGQKELITNRLKEFLKLDSHVTDEQYMIRSLYFDDMWSSSYEEKMMGILSRKKYRIRIYNCDDGFISLECKAKEGSYILKRSARLTREECDAIIAGDIDVIKGREEELVKEFYHALSTNGLKPEVIVDYDRIPFIYDPGTVRITFDMNLRAAFNGYDIFDSTLPVFNAMDQDMLIMEVKYTEFLPEIIRSVIMADSLIYTAASKFTLCDDVKRNTYGMEIFR
ncbi:MAG: polyphosphate polymerase domain-containing protein [Lachnospiraceae bacterium]|nr:polyphosphate polymerase domain-containing protein [Lachnospiraceae bacterium]